ncbi:putative eukaryotic translation initiation factor 5 [Mycena venus]|uniref:Putative eukaryotic translation initiation factor 5 n=1 Tax=Mycena venus TaxID=2733690 RepID=A0A8H7CHQ8_9AGAR|nr:putative eukaryotic translation initiation factor 5 [Mycena venus]
MLSRRQLVVTGCLVFLPFLIWQFVALNEQYSLAGGSFKLWPSTICSAILPAQEDKLVVPQKRHRVAVASIFGFHFDTYLPVVWTLERVMGRSPTGGTVEVYAPDEFGFEFQKIVDTLGLYHGEVKHSDELIGAINSNMGDGGIDMVVLGTCEFDLRDGGPWPEALLAAWDARDAAHKFQLVCLVHNVRDQGWQHWITQWSQRNAIRILPISEHVAAAFKRSFLINADSPNATIRAAGYEYIPVDVHVPVLDIPVAVDHSPSRILSDVVIQGSFATDRRDYLEIFSELKESLARWLEIPHELKNMVFVHTGLSYPDFYKLMSEMDICVPAFFGDHSYYEDQASSTFAMAVECNVPILVTERMRKSYAYVDDDRAVVTRPAAMREIEALRALRSRDTSYFLNRTGIPMDSHTARAAAHMLRLGWVRSEEESRGFKQEIWKANDRVVERLLRDL